MKIVILGSGYVGAVTGLCLSDIGHRVTCYDLSTEKINIFKSGKIPFYEKGLQKLLSKNLKNKSFSVTSDFEEAFNDTDISIIAVGTPFKNGRIDLQQIISASEMVGKMLKTIKKFHVVCIKSTVKPGTTSGIVKETILKNTKKIYGKDWGLVMNPEFLAEGTAVNDFMFPDRIIIGSEDKKSISYIKNLYRKFTKSETMVVSLETAEMIKYTSNSFLATAISFSNEIANLCDKIDGVDSIEVLKGLHLDNRLSPLINGNKIKPGFLSFLHPGIGYGGSCFPKDVNTLVEYGNSMNVSMNILENVIKKNKVQYKHIIEKLNFNFERLSGKRIAVLGLAFKPGTDDVRETPALNIIRDLLQKNVRINAHDPKSITEFKKLIKHKNLFFYESIDDAINNADAIILLTAWPIYKKFLNSKTIDTLIVDGRRFLNKKSFINYQGIGLAKN